LLHQNLLCQMQNEHLAMNFDLPNRPKFVVEIHRQFTMVHLFNNLNGSSNPNFTEEPVAVKSVPPDVQQMNENIGLIVRTEEEYSVLWSPVHDLVRIQFGYNEAENPHNLAIVRIN
jgi:hypothetical protein